MRYSQIFPEGRLVRLFNWYAEEISPNNNIKNYVQQKIKSSEIV